MKTLVLTIATLISLNTFADLGSKTLLTCKDQKSRVLTISQLTRLTGGGAGDLVATLQSATGKLMLVSPVMYSHMDVTFPATYGGKNILVSIDSIIPMNLAADERSGSLKYKKEKAVPMICKIELEQTQPQPKPEYSCLETVDCMPPLMDEESKKYCSAEYYMWTAQHCLHPVDQLQ